jgi:hypothetical protein
MKYEYGIRNRRTGEIHRREMTREQAWEWMDPEEWGGLTPTRIFCVVRRPIGDWEEIPNLAALAAEAEAFEAA